MQHYIFGYGSLMSHDSRWRFSDINAEGVAATLTGWQRAWNMACSIENFTCVGVLPDSDSRPDRAIINGKLFPVPEISENLQQREQNYQFVQIDSEQLALWDEQHRFPWGEDDNERCVWICRLRNPGQSSQVFPIYQTYVDTCIVGCLEDIGEQFARQFIRSTCNWQGYWVNDRNQPQYPRAAKVGLEHQQHIDDLLADEGVLQFRLTP
ncbi:MAG: gamma-glutamylcyclotransferase family protein [Aestuariibacter sp.]